MFRTPIFYLSLLSLVLITILPGNLQAQSLVSGSADYKENTAYPTFPVNDPIYFFCTQEGTDIGSLTTKSVVPNGASLWCYQYTATTRLVLSQCNIVA